MPRLLKIISVIFIAFVCFTCFAPILKAEADAKTKAMYDAIVLAQAITEAEKKLETPPVEVSKEYRQKLSSDIVAVEQKEEEEFKNELDSYVRFIPGRSLTSQPGKISVIESAAEYNYNFKLFGQLPIQLGVGAGNVNINADDAVPVSLPTQLKSVVFGAETTIPLFEIDKTYLRFGIMPSFYSDNWNFKANSFNLSSVAMIIYQPNKMLTLVAGVASLPGFEDPILPIMGLIYKPNDKLTFNLIPDRPNISYCLTDRFSVFVEGNLSGGEYKVTKDGSKAALGYNETHAGCGAKFRVNKYIDASLSTGRLFNHYLKYKDSLGKVNIKNGLYTEFRLEMRI